MQYLILLVLKIEIISSAKKVLKKQYADDVIVEILQAYKKRYRQLKTSAPRESTLGGRVLVELAAMCVAFHNQIMERGQSKEKATKTLYDLTWLVYQKMGKLTWLISSIGAKSNYTHLQKATGFFRRFPFTPPSYLWEDVDTGEGIIGFNCLRCPIAKYFESQNLSNVCVETWCNLDFLLAGKIWHSELIRTGSIAGGAEICDFRWKAVS